MLLLQPYDFERQVTSDFVLYAKWVSPSVLYTVKFDPNGGTFSSSSAPISQLVAGGTMVEKPTSNPGKYDAGFTGWYTTPELTKLYDFYSPVNSNFTLYAGYSKIMPSMALLPSGASIGAFAATQEVYSQVGTVEAYEYDVFNHLVNTANGDMAVQYAYKPDGLRLSKTVNGDKTTHIWDGSNIVAQLNGSGDVKDVYIRGFNLIKSKNHGYYLYNAHVDVVQLTDNNGVVTKSYVYDAFGVEVEPDAGDMNPFRYCEEYFDSNSHPVTLNGPYPESAHKYGFRITNITATVAGADVGGQYYLRARYYDPSSGRFLTEDSYEYMNYDDPLSLNLYTYCHNNPLKYYDPSGNTPEDILYGFITALDDSVFGGYAQNVVEFFMGSLNSQFESEYDYYLGRVAGDIVGMASGAGTSIWGVLEMGSSIIGGGTVTIGSGGTLAIGGVVIVAEGVAVGAATTATGVGIAVMASSNFGNDFNKMNELGKTERKKPVSGSGKEKSTDKPSWVNETPYKAESGKDFAKRLMDEKYGSGNYKTGPDSEFNKIKKWADRAFK